VTKTEDFYTLLCSRADGVAPVVDVLPTEDIEVARLRAQRLLVEHRSCERVEIWRDGALHEEVRRP
jgi:hypothetical protein